MSKPAPPGWNKTLDELFEEMKRGERFIVTSDECDWASDYERSLLPPGTLFPRADQLWETADTCDVQVNYVFAAPASFSGTATLAPGERVRIIKGGADQKPLIVSFLPLRYDELHATLVPADVRAIPRYTNYVLSAKIASFNQHFRIIGPL